MDPEASSQNLELSSEQQSITHVIVEEVPNSQNPRKTEHEYNPFISQSQHLSQPGPSQRPSQSCTESVAKRTSLRKRRGRPSKDTLTNLRPLRESQRSRKCTRVLSYETFKEPRWQWSEEDKQSFLAGCMEVGIEDIEGLRRFLPHKTPQDIKNQIGMWKELATSSLTKQLLTDKNTVNVKGETMKNLDEWLNHFKEGTKSSNASTFAMSNIFSLIADYGVFPSPEECGGINFRAMYRYVSCLMNGVPPYGLDTLTSRVLLSCIDNVNEILDDSELTDNMEDHLFNLSTKSEKWSEKFGKTYERKTINPSSKSILQIVSNPTMNPLNLSKNALGIEESEDEE